MNPLVDLFFGVLFTALVGYDIWNYAHGWQPTAGDIGWAGLNVVLAALSFVFFFRYRRR